MKFSLWNFRDWYEQHGLDLSHLIMDNTASISMLASSPTAAQGRIGCALVQSGSDQPDSTGFRTVLRFGNDRILFPIASSAEVLNCGNAMISHYTNWENNLFDQITAGCSIEALLSATQDHFPFPIALYHTNGSQLVKTEDWLLPPESRLIKSILSSIEQDYNRTQPFLNTLHSNRPYTFMACTLHARHAHAGTLIAYETDHKFQPGDIHIFRTICETLEIAIVFLSNPFESIHPLASWFSQAIKAEHPPVPEQNKTLCWKEEDFYQIACIRPSNPKSTSQLCSQLTDNNHCCIPIENGIAMLIHLGSDLNPASTSEQERLELQSLSQIASAGYSLPFQKLKHITCYYSQALWAKKRADADKVLHVSLVQYLPEYIFQTCKSASDVQAFIHPDILRISEIDRSENNQLLKTLYTYLVLGCSISQTADALYIHRNTLRSRLKRIQSLLTLSCEDAAERNLLLLSLLIYHDS